MSVEVSTPAELWMLWRVANNVHDEGWVCSLDGVSGMGCYLAFPSRESAMESAGYHRTKYDLECHPVRVHPTP